DDLLFPDSEMIIIKGTGNSNVLKQAAVPVMSYEMCQKAYDTINISRSMICAGYPEGGHDSCKDDYTFSAERKHYAANTIFSILQMFFPLRKEYH
ncbi:enteropeptidase, partial [Nephila pilipes]